LDQKMKIKDAALAVFVALMWGSAFVVIEAGLKELPPVFNASLRFFAAALPLVFFIPRPQVHFRWVAAIGAAFVCMFTLMYVGMKLGMPAGLTSLVLQSQALFASLMAIIVFNDRPTHWQKSGILLGFTGIALVAKDMSVGSTLPLILVVGAAFFYGMISILMKKAGPTNMVGLIVWVSLIPPLPLLALSLVMEHGQWQAIVNISAIGIAAILYPALFGTVLAFALWGKLLRVYSPHVVTPFALLVPVFGMGLSAIILDEAFSPTKLAASGLIMFGLTLMVVGGRAYDATLLYFRKSARENG
jgi:O-acetylserine/cysteine efflux transporter